MITDAKIWNDFRSGEPSALSHIYHQNAKFLYNYGRKFSDNHEIVKDTIQDLFYDLIRNRKTLGETNNIRFYLMRSFRRKLLLNLKKETPNLIASFLESERQENNSIEESWINHEINTERKQQLEFYMKQLHPRQREILFYRYSCDMDYEEICKIMSLKYNSARMLMHRALESLRKLIGDLSLLPLLLLCWFQ